MKKIIIILILSINLFSVESIDKVKENLSKVKSYSANIDIEVDITYVNIPPRSGKIYYKSPDKLKIDIPGLSMLPKTGVGNFIERILSNPTNTYIDAGQAKVNGVNTSIIKALPTDTESEIVLATVWIDENISSVIKAEVTTKTIGTVLVELDYKIIDNKAYLPVKTVITTDIPKMAIPKTFASAEDKEKAKKKDLDPESNTTKAIVKVKYSNYKLNQDISDEIFIQD